ncbi:Progesterone-induced-blocking factor 1 [Phytophthora cactorum]|nr:Progesterone-induced-blocking factor 1 [Phytophthora cactorum]
MTDEDRRFRRLAAQLGVSRHVLGPDDAAEATDGVEATAQRSEHEAAEGRSTSRGQTTRTKMKKKIDLSLPHSFGHYDQLPTSRGISHFDDHLAALSPGQLPSGRTNRLQQTPQRVVAMGANSSTSAGGSEAVMKKFYEIQVGKIRGQLALSVQAQRELEKTLQQERAAWQEKEADMEHRSSEERGRLEKELKQAQADLQAAQTRLRMEKTHFASLQISDALAEQLSRQNEEDLSIRECIQLSIHSKVRKLETELERCRQEVETLQKSSSVDKAAAAGASDEIAQVQRIAEAKERRLQHELVLSEATRQELENQIKALVDQFDGMKEEQRRNEEIYGDQRGVQKESERLKRDLQVLQRAHDDLKSRFDEVSAGSSDLHQKIALLTADKTFLQDAKTQLEEQVAKMRVSQQEMQEKVNSLQEKNDGNLSQNVQLQNETRLHFEKKFDDEMAKFMELSKREIERIRNDGQVVYERENRLLKEARDDALKHAEVLQARLDSVQSALDEKASWLKEHLLLGGFDHLCFDCCVQVLEATRMESTHTTALAAARNELKMRHFEISQLKLTLEEKARDARNARLEVDMLTQKVEAHKEEFTRLETTSTTRITHLEAALDVEEYELLEIDLDGAVVQPVRSLLEAKGTRQMGFKAPRSDDHVWCDPTTTKRRARLSDRSLFSAFTSMSSVSAERTARPEGCQVTTRSDRAQQKLNEVTSDRSRLQQQIAELKAKLANFHQPQSYLIDKLTRREQELQGAMRRYEEAQEQLQQLRAQYQQTQDANASLQHQLQQLLSRRGDLDALKATVQLLRGKIQAPSHQKELRNENYKLQVAQDHGFTIPRQTANAAVAGTVNSASPSPIVSATAKVSPPLSIASKMTQPPTPQRQLNSVRAPSEASSSSSSISSTPGGTRNFDPLPSSKCTRGPDDALKAEFKRWLKKEVVLLAFMVAAGAAGVHFYQVHWMKELTVKRNREWAPVKQVERLVKQAERSVKEGDPKQALKHCLHAYDVIKGTNPHDRHLFELAFSIAAQYESLGRGRPATNYYLDALEHNSREMNVASRERNRVVTLDRIAQVYENRGHVKTAERYFKQAISAYDQSRGRRELSKASRIEAMDLVALDREIPGVLFNYSQLLMANKRWSEAGNALQRALTLARVSSLSDEYVEYIEGAMASVKSAMVAEKAEAKQKHELK